MSQLLKKFALLTACAVLALCFATRPAHAQSVAANGTGEHLLFAYWTTANYTDTYVAVHSPLGLRDSGETMNVAKVVVRDDMGEEAVTFKICLTPGDTWTAGLSMNGLTVGDAGGCDDKVEQESATRSSTPVPTPGMEETVSLGDADSGYLEVFLTPNGGLVDGSVGCETSESETTAARQCVTNAVAGGDDVDNAADNATPRYISGSATLVSPMSGFSSTYNATALVGCGASAGAAILPNSSGDSADDNNGCWKNTGEATEPSGRPIMRALQGNLGNAETLEMTSDLLTGRWTAVDNDNIMSHTKLILTFPMNHLNYKGVLKDADGEVEGTDPVSIIAFDEAGAIVFDHRELMLDMNVNMCMFGGGMDDGHDDMDMDMDDDMTMPMLSCNGMDVEELTAMGGSFRIFNNKIDNVPPAGATGEAVIAEANRTDGAEITKAPLSTTNNQDGPGNTVRDDTGGQDPAEPLGAIGLIFSYFEGTNDLKYDQVTPVQTVDVAADATNL